MNVCNKIQSGPCLELFKDQSIIFTEYDEGTEPGTFFEIIGGNDPTAYNCLLKAKETYEYHTSRLYEFTSKNGSFEANEIFSNMRTSDHPTIFPFIQEGIVYLIELNITRNTKIIFSLDLYNCRQPSLFMLDNEYALYIWVGWWPVEDAEILQDDINNVDNRAGESRFQQERFEAMSTASAYWKTKCSGSDYEKKAFIISAGFEPTEFITIFPEWTVRDDIAELNGEDGATSSTTTIEEYLSLYKQKTYPLNELLDRKCKLEGINRFKMELYLTENDFEMCLGMKKEEFNNLPLWKKNKLKKEKGLF